MIINKKILVLAFFCVLIFGLSNSGLHPVTGSSGYTGAPGDSNCAQCHTGNNSSLNGAISIDGLPSSIETGETYTITVTITNPNGNAAKAGFQLVALNGTNGNAGDMSTTEPNAQIRVVAGNKKYFGHAPASDFPASNTLSFNVDWTAPTTTGSNPVIKFYASSVIANGANGNQNDRVVLTNMIIPIVSGAAPLDVIISNITNTSCSDSADGSATAVASGGTGVYNYIWNNGVTDATNNSLPSGLASVTVTDNASGNSSTSTFIGSPAPLLISASGSIVCPGESNGGASAIASGGSGGYIFTWSTGENGNTINGLSAGNYVVTVTDVNNCTATTSADVIESSPIIIIGDVISLRCNNTNDGSINLNASGGTPNYTYQWSNGSTSNPLNNLSPGFYTVTVSDATFCTGIETYQITEPQPLNVQISNLQNASCFGFNNGSATITVSGGTPGYIITWSNGAIGTSSPNTQNNLSAGIYNVTVTDIYDCQEVVQVEITEPMFLQINTVTETQISCNGANDGALSLSVSQNVGDIFYTWSNGATTSSISNLSPGVYTVTIQDEITGCTENNSYNIIEPESLNIITNGEMSVLCFEGNNGSISIDAVGGNGQYVYLWSTGTSGPNLSNIIAGTYQVTVTDLKNCSSTKMFFISQPGEISISLIESTNVTCVGANNGSLTVVASNGSEPYNYAWSNGNTGNNLSNLEFGAYFATITDSNNCQITDTFSVLADSAFSLSLLSKTDVSCFGDSTGIIQVVKDTTYTYTWSNNMTGDIISGVPAGLFTVVATDTSSCQSLPLQVQINQPALIKANLVQADSILCLSDTSGFLKIELTGGFGKLNHQWSNGDSTLLIDSLLAGIYTVSVTDENNCLVNYNFQIYQSDTLKVDSFLIQSPKCAGESNGSIFLYPEGGFGNLNYNWSNNAMTGDSVYNLKKGSYIVTITDFGTCKLVDTFDVNQPDTLSSMNIIVDESVTGANDGKITLQPIGGTSPFKVKWNTGDTTFVIENLAPGLYSFKITDNNGCTTSDWIVVGGGNCVLSSSYETKPSTCFNGFDGSISLKIAGDFNDYFIQVFKDDKEININLDSLSSGKYTIIITDSLQCQNILTGIIINSVYPEIKIETLETVLPSSSTTKDGKITINASGGAGNFMYQWFTNGDIVGTENTLENIGIGSYFIIISDSEGCTLESDTIELNTISEVNHSLLYNEIKIAPNPVSSLLTIFNESRYPIERILITDLQGTKIHQESPEIQSNTITLNFNDIALEGIYILTMWINNTQINKKIVILK